MFLAKRTRLFIGSAILIIFSYVGMAVDPAPSGFGILTLWIAPPLLLLGLVLPMLGIIGIENIPKLSTYTYRLITWKHAFGMLAFCIALTTYLLTLEPTASLWDCSELIACAYKLQVPHTPGNPLLLLIGRLFSMLASDVHHVARMVNIMSALFSALAVMLAYHITFYFGEKIISSNDKWRTPFLIVGSLSGSLCLAFSDTFWYSAVEAETYGASCFFILLLLWIMLKGSECAGRLRPRMFVLISYLSALSYCIHPMCLLVLPIFPLVWFVNGKTVNLKTTILTLFMGAALVFIINRFIAIGFFELIFKFDLFAVNKAKLPFYSGVVILLLLMSSIFYFLFRKFSNHTMYTWAVVFLLFGFLPYVMLFIRSNQNPPIDETNPEDLYSIKAYMNRESYPSSPFLYGPYFDAGIEKVIAKNKVFYKGATDYAMAGTRVDYQFEKSRETILPRLYSRDANHIMAYRQWLGLPTNEKPTFIHNIEFMLTYQLGHMYLRYLMWNFVGREGDVQGSSWLKPWDRVSNGSSERARNQYWMIPLLLGILGAFSQFRKDKRGFTINSVFFLFTGLVLALYLNSPPIEPRERDYIYVASYIAFSIWIGLGTMSIRPRFIKAGFLFTFIASASVALPAWMLYQNYDDHNRSGRTLQVDYAKAVLNSCSPNAVLFTAGDNDTFPLWYLQEVEGFRTDVRVMVLSYFNTDWYINQLQKSYYNSPPLQLTLGQKDYRQYGPNDILYVEDQIKEGIDVHQYLTLLKQEHPALRVSDNNGDFYHLLPSRMLKLKISGEMSKEMSIKVTGNYLEKNALAILDVIVSNEWKRPLYFNAGSMNSLDIDLKPYLVLEGLVYRLRSDRNENGTAVNTHLTYKNLVAKANYSNLADPNVYFNYEDFHARIISLLRKSFNELADAYLEEGNTAMAEKVLMDSVEKLHYAHLLPSYTDLDTAAMLIDIGKNDVAKSITIAGFDYYHDRVNSSLQQKESPDQFELYMLEQSTALLSSLGETHYVNRFEALGLNMEQ